MLLIDWFSANVTQIWSEIERETQREREGNREKDRDRPMTVCVTEGGQRWGDNV